MKNRWANLKKRSHRSHTSHIYVSRWYITQCCVIELRIIRSHILQSGHTLHNPVEGEGLDEREHEQRTEEHEFWCTNRESWITNKGLTSLSSRMFHGLSPLEFHGVVIEGLEPCFASIEPHAPTFWDKVPKLNSKARFQIDKRGAMGSLSGVG